jgi:DNA-binding NtrC family response regulator
MSREAGLVTDSKFKMNHGAFDYVTEAFTVPELVYVLRKAIEDACQTRANPE